MIDRITSFIGTCIGTVIGFLQIDIMPFMLKVSVFHIPEECKTLLMAFGGGVMAWCGGRACSWLNKQLKSRRNG